MILNIHVRKVISYFNVLEFQPQCLGPRCCKPARRKSKYCSDACGRALAAKRIERFLMPKLEKMAEYPSVATIEQTAKLEKLKASYNTILKGSDQKNTNLYKFDRKVKNGLISKFSSNRLGRKV